MENKSFGNRKIISTAGVIITPMIIMFFLGLISNNYQKEAKPNYNQVLKEKPILRTVAAEGILEPEGKVITVSSPTSARVSSKVEKLFVKLGDKVKAGQLIATLDNYKILQAAVNKSQKQIAISQANLAKVKAGAKQGEIDARKANIENIKAELQGQILVQRANIKSLEAEIEGQILIQQQTLKRLNIELQNATRECNRYSSLARNGAVSFQERDTKCLQPQVVQTQLSEAQKNQKRIKMTGTEQINESRAALNRTIATLKEQKSEAKANLAQTKNIRAEDIAIVQAELENAQAGLTQAQAELEQAYVRSPCSCQILQINTQPGEIIASDGILKLGRTDQMYVVAEVYENDASKIKIGQNATITSDGFPQILKGNVSSIGLNISRRKTSINNTKNNTEAKILEVKIRLDAVDSQQVRKLTNLTVKVVIEILP